MTIKAVIGSDLSSPFTRRQVFATLFVLGFANGIVANIVGKVLSDGYVMAVTGTFGISVIVWVACFLGVKLVLGELDEPLTKADRVVALAALTLFLVPISQVSWVVLSGLAIYFLRTSRHGTTQARGAWIILAITVPMFWSPRLFSILSDSILQLDAMLVSFLLGTQRLGNSVQLVDGSGYMWIASGCSSMANVSLAILCWVLFSQFSDRQRSPGDLWWCLLACGAVAAVNVVRISLIGRYPEQFELLHGPIGGSLAGGLSLGLMLVICAAGGRRVSLKHR